MHVLEKIKTRNGGLKVVEKMWYKPFILHSIASSHKYNLPPPLIFYVSPLNFTRKTNERKINMKKYQGMKKWMATRSHPTSHTHLIPSYVIGLYPNLHHIS